MKSVVIVLFAALLCSCAQHDTLIPVLPSQCSVEQTDERTATIKCEDGSVAVLHSGQDGLNGKDGTNGLDGRDGVDGLAGIDGTNGRDGLNGVDGRNGIDGLNGLQGIQGPQGAQGSTGIQGIIGPSGPRGLDGPSGASGPIGLAGRDGLMGPTGPKGDTGFNGYSGLYCGISTQKYNGNIGGWAAVRSVCETTCGTTSAHMCDATEMSHSWQLAMDTGPNGWISSGHSYQGWSYSSYPQDDCRSWHFVSDPTWSGPGMGMVAGGVGGDGGFSFSFCDALHYIVCCD